MVPDGWKVSTVGNHVDLLTGFAFRSVDYSDDGVRLLRGDNVGQGVLRWRDAKFWPTADAANHERYRLAVGDVVIALDRTWIPAGLKVCEVTPADLPCLLVQRVSRLRARHGVEQRLLRYWLSTSRFEQHVKTVQTETAVPHISPADVRDFPLLLPPPAEQSKIADVLATWDRAITIVDRLIENSESQWRALMQQLLSGRRRLPGFSGVWTQRTVSSLGPLRKGQGLSRDQLSKVGVPCILYGDLYTKYHYSTHVLSSFVSAEAAEEAQPIRRGDLLFAGSGETAEEIGKCVAYLGDPPACAGGDIIVLSPTDSDPEFLGYFLNCQEVARQKAHAAQGHSVVHIRATHLGQIQLSLPERKEQTAIASVLTNARRQTMNYKDQRDGLWRQRAALMQLLLSGKRRLQSKGAA